MTPRTSDQSAEIRRRRRAQILDAATPLLLGGGYAALRMDRVAAAAGVSKGLVYWYFKSKPGLVRAVVEHRITELVDPLLATLSSAGDPATRLRTLLDSVLDEFDRQAQNWLEFFGLARDPEAFELTRDAIGRAYQAFIDALAAEFTHLGALRPYASATVLAAALDGLAALPMFGLNRPQRADLRAVLESLIASQMGGQNGGE